MSVGGITIRAMELTPVQERTLVELMARDDPRPVFDKGLRDRLSGLIEEKAAPALAKLREGEYVWLSKSRLADLMLRCEGLYQANVMGEGVFELSLPLAVGRLVHRAIEADVIGERLAEAELVDKALARLRTADPQYDRYVQTLDEVEHAELLGEAIRRITLFRGTMPPLQKAWGPVPELRLKQKLADGKLIISGQVDLSLGRPRDEAPMEARRLFIELKTGADRPEFVDDLRFYALLATLYFGVPPFRIATLLLDDGSYRPEDVTEDVLEAAARRVAAAVTTHVELTTEREPVLRPGPWCRWCPRAATCPVAQL